MIFLILTFLAFFLLFFPLVTKYLLEVISSLSSASKPALIIRILDFSSLNYFLSIIDTLNYFIPILYFFSKNFPVELVLQLSDPTLFLDELHLIDILLLFRHCVVKLH